MPEGFDSNDFKNMLIKAKQKEVRKEKFKSKLINPRIMGNYKGLMRPEVSLSMQMFRRVAEKAWLINAVVGHIIDKVIPYCRPTTDKGKRGFSIDLKDTDAKMSAKLKKRSKEIQEFFLKTGWDNSLQHEDDLNSYIKKTLRDLLVLDQTATEKLWSNGGDLLSFEAVDGATVLRCTEEGYEGDDKIKYVQMIDTHVYAQYQGYQMLLGMNNPRTDVNTFGYGYSKIEQCISLVTASIHAFQFNAGAFTEDKLPRGMILLNGDMDFDAMEEMEDYMSDVMSQSRWSVPIIPSGAKDSSLSWQSMGNNNQEMQYSKWLDYLTTGMTSIFGVDLESMGLKTDQGAKIMEGGSAEGKKYSDDKGIGNCLTWLERHLQNLLDAIDPQFKFTFYGFEQDDAQDSRDAIESQLKTFKSLNDVLKEQDMPLCKEPWADIPGLQNPQYTQLYMAEHGQEGQEDDGSGEEQSEDGEQGYDEFDEDFGKSLKDKEELTIII